MTDRNDHSFYFLLGTDAPAQTGAGTIKLRIAQQYYARVITRETAKLKTQPDPSRCSVSTTPDLKDEEVGLHAQNRAIKEIAKSILEVFSRSPDILQPDRKTALQSVIAVLKHWYKCGRIWMVLEDAFATKVLHLLARVEVELYPGASTIPSKSYERIQVGHFDAFVNIIRQLRPNFTKHVVGLSKLFKFFENPSHDDGKKHVFALEKMDDDDILAQPLDSAALRSALTFEEEILPIIIVD